MNSPKVMTDHPSTPVSTLYRFCAQGLRYPEPDWFTEEYVSSLYLLLDSVGATEEAAAIRQKFNSSADTLEELQIEYTRLFINGVRHVIAPPYGSVYQDRVLQGPHTEKTRNFYKQHGFDVDKNGELPDHLVNQLEFIALLIAQNNTTAKTAFLREIFHPWFPKFMARIQQEANHPYYSVIVQLIDYLTKEDDENGIQHNEA